jgi:hypothetical protein
VVQSAERLVTLTSGPILSRATPAGEAMAKVTALTHASVQIVQIDFTGCRPGMFAAIIQEAEEVICRQPPRSVRAITVFDDSVLFNAGSVVEMQRFASRVMPYLRGNALVGITGMKRIAFNAVRPLYRVPVELFSDTASAAAWVARL